MYAMNTASEYISLLGFSEPISSMTHLFGALIYLIFGMIFIYKGRGNNLRVSALVLYVFCGVFLFSMSGVYHLLEKGTTANYVLRILDHAGIYVMISGTFTPFQVILLRGAKRWLPLAGIWILAITGLTLTSVFFSDMSEKIILTFFISMGWMSLFTVWFVRKIDIQTVKLIFLGGIFYTVGAIFDFLRWPNLIEGVLEGHELFHIFVLAGAFAHFYAIYLICTKPISQELVLIIKNYPRYSRGYFITENTVFEGSDLEEVKKSARQWVRASYDSAHIPKSITVKYFNEDIVEID